MWRARALGWADLEAKEERVITAPVGRSWQQRNGVRAGRVSPENKKPGREGPGLERCFR